MNPYEKQLLTLQNLYHVTEIPFLIVSTNGKVVLSMPGNLATTYKADYWLNIPDTNSKIKNPDEPILFEVGQFCYVAIAKLDTNLFLTTVPIRTNRQYSQNFYPTFINGISADKQLDFYRFLLEVPIKTTYQLAEFTSLCKMLYCNETTSGINIFSLDHNKNIPAHAPFYITPENLYIGKHAALDFEKKILSAISDGAEAELQHAFIRSPYGIIGQMSLNALHQARYEFICMIYASCRAAISGGLSEEYAFTLSDSMCQKMDSLYTVDAINNYSQKCMTEFCHQVHIHSESRNYSSYTKACCDYITEHLFQSITLDEISKTLGLNKKSLSSYFKKDLGISIFEYIMKRRLEEASYLLTNSNMNISAISELLHFSSQSHFTDKFRKKYGITPLQYRINHVPVQPAR